jgi:hypothetical protein
MSAKFCSGLSLASVSSEPSARALKGVAVVGFAESSRELTEPLLVGLIVRPL